MTDLNKRRDETCDNPEFNIGDTKMDAILLGNRKWGWDACLTDLASRAGEARQFFIEFGSFSMRVVDERAQLEGWTAGGQPVHVIEAAPLLAKIEQLEAKVAELTDKGENLCVNVGNLLMSKQQIEAKLAKAVEALKFISQQSSHAEMTRDEVVKVECRMSKKAFNVLKEIERVGSAEGPRDE